METITDKTFYLMLVSGHGQLLDVELVQDVALELVDVVETFLKFKITHVQGSGFESREKGEM